MFWIGRDDRIQQQFGFLDVTDFRFGRHFDAVQIYWRGLAEQRPEQEEKRGTRTTEQEKIQNEERIEQKAGEDAQR